MYRIECKWNYAIVQCVLTHTHTLNEWMTLKNVNKIVEIWGEHYSWVEMKCLVATQYLQRGFYDR